VSSVAFGVIFLVIIKILCRVITELTCSVESAIEHSASFFAEMDIGKPLWKENNDVATNRQSE
jgi:hypothetical protein